MKVESLKKRLDKNRPMTTITIRIPEDVIDDLKRIAPLLGFSGYQPLVRAYIGQGLRTDLERLEGDTVFAVKSRAIIDCLAHGSRESHPNYQCPKSHSPRKEVL